MRRIFALAIFLAACARPVPVVPVPDAQDAELGESAAPDPTGCIHACANLARLLCPEGLRSNCEASCRSELNLTNVNTACLSQADSRAAARQCAGLGDGGCP